MTPTARWRSPDFDWRIEEYGACVVEPAPADAEQSIETAPVDRGSRQAA
jgi:hypothetical protein